jgi:hypothetical protein
MAASVFVDRLADAVYGIASSQRKVPGLQVLGLRGICGIRPYSQVPKRRDTVNALLFTLHG